MDDFISNFETEKRFYKFVLWIYWIFYFISGGENFYKFHKTDKLLSEYTTVSDEALAILIYENNIETRIDMANKKLPKIQMWGENTQMVVPLMVK